MDIDRLIKNPYQGFLSLFWPGEGEGGRGGGEEVLGKERG